jgi:DNA-binding GntR family transcriptional regulator
VHAAPHASPIGTVASQIAQQLRERVLTGAIAPGSRLMQNHVAAEFGVSSTPVREAFTELVRDGYARGVPRRGVEVIAPSLADARQAAEVHALLEGACVAASVPHLTDADLQCSRDLLDEHRAVPATDRRRGQDLDTAFHLSLLAGCPNTRLRELASRARADTVVHRLVLVDVEEPSGEVVRTLREHHEAIYEACLERDADRAAALTVEHIEWGARIFAEPPA